MGAKILVIEDDRAFAMSLEKSLMAKGYTVFIAFGGAEALEAMKAHRPDLLLLDIRMPGMDGLEVLRGAMALDGEAAVVMMTAVGELDVAISAMKKGASDYLTKPVHLEALALAMEKALERRRLLIENRRYRERLEEMVREKTQELQAAYGELKRAHLGAVKALAEAIEAKDPYTRGHSARVCRLSLRMAERLGLSQREREMLEYGCILHDVGKIGIRGAVLNKDSPLTPEEYAHVQEHPVKGEKILKEVPFFHPILPVVRHHHERSDGNGYPDGLRGGELSSLLKVIIVADAFDAMTSDRPYRKARGLQETLSILKENAGTQFDPEVVHVFLDHRIYEEEPERSGRRESHKGVMPQTGRILIVDDEPELSNLLSSFLTGKGYEVTTAADGEEAMAKVKELRPHLVLLDIWMPGRDGVETLKQIKALELSPEVIMVSAVDEEEIAKKTLDLGAADYIKKPMDLEYLEMSVSMKIVEVLGRTA